MERGLGTVVEVVREAGRRVLGVYRSADVGLTHKADKSPLTRADLESNGVILEGLRRLSPHPVISEESLPDPSAPPPSGPFWLVDPLDGTKDFLAKNDEFTINVALVEGGKPVLGVTYAPALDLMYFAEGGRGSFLSEGGGPPRRIRNERRGKELIAAESRFHSSVRVRRFCRRYGVRQVLKFGSALKFCRLAEGAVDVYPRFGPTSEWDTASGHCVAAEAGCRVTASGGGALRYGKPGWRNPLFVAYRAGLDFSDWREEG